MEVQARSPASQVPATPAVADVVRASRRLLDCVAEDVPRGTSTADWVSIHRFVEATGDENRLYLDADYGAASVHGTMLAPPTFVLAVQVPESVGALGEQPSGLLDLLTSVSITWWDHIRLGDQIGSDLRIAAVGEGLPWRRRTTACVTSEAHYTRPGGYPIGRACGTVTLYPLRRGEERFVEREVHCYSDSEIQALVAHLDQEPPGRGGRPRFWEDVTVGDSLPALVKGPLTLSDLITWVVAEAKPVKLSNLVHRDLQDRPGRLRTNPATDWPYWDSRQAREDLHACADAGFPAPYGRGAMRVALAGQLITHWMGDEAFLRRLDVDLPQPYIYGDTMTLGGTVRDTFVQVMAGRRYYAVALQIVGRNQVGDTIVDGTALVFLPRRGEPVQVPLPLPIAAR
jgi:acyl dehydratase